MNSDFKFVHAADLHLDSPFRGVAAESRLGPVFRESTVRAFRRVVALCLREKVDFLLLAGDLFDARDRSVRARLVLHQGLSELDHAGIQTFIVHGNHDPLTAGDDLRWPSSVKVFGPEWEEVPVMRGPHLIARIQGISYPQERVTENLSQRFHRLGPQFTVGLLHANVGGVGTHANYAPCTLSDLAEAGLDYWALGHVHTRADLDLSGGGVAVYPGNTQGRHINEAGERGCLLVQVRDFKAKRTFVPTDSVRWHRLELDIDDLELETLDALMDNLSAELMRCAGSGGDQEGHAVRVVLSGRGPLSAKLRDPGAIESLETHLCEWGTARNPPLLIESVVDQTSPELDLEAIRRAGGLAGAVIELGRGLAPDDLWTAEELKRLDSNLRSAQLLPTRADHESLMPRAIDRALELLLEGEA